MSRWILALSLLGTALLLGQNANKKTPKPPDLEILEVTAVRHGDQIHVDGRVKNAGVKPLEKVVVVVDFFAPNRKPMVSKRGPVDAEVLEPGEEADFKLAMNDPGQLVSIELQAVDRRERDLRLSKSGPFSID
jgi:Protein of unknown function (DUF2393)